GNMTDRIGHGQHGEAEGQGDAGEADPEFGKGGGEDGAAAPAEHQPEGSDQLSQTTLHVGHVASPFTRPPLRGRNDRTMRLARCFVKCGLPRARASRRRPSSGRARSTSPRSACWWRLYAFYVV